ncbi:MAG: tetratricopeptide repeat protein, partial [Acidobacteria bacterium]|nr:tetratricopeptide repeat protein [Acidobacteriota bacterium]
RAALTALQGLGGVGKTQLATEYTYRYAGDYELVWWVRSEEPATLSGDLAQLATVVGLPEADVPTRVELVRRYLEGRTGWLLVFDNVNQPGDLRDILPRGGGHVLITSRRQDWAGTARAFDVRPFSPEEAVAYFAERAGTDRTDTESSEAAAAALAEDLGYLPLALSQAASYMQQTGLSTQAYRDLFQTRRAELLHRGASLDHDPVAVTWKVSFEELERDSPAASALLRLCAFLAPGDIPLELLEAGAEHLPEPLSEIVTNPLDLRDAIGAAARLSLLEPASDSLSIHRLVQAALRGDLSSEDRGLWAGAAVTIVNRAFRYDQNDLASWPYSTRLMPHGIAAAGHAEGAGVALEAMSELLNNTGLFLKQRGDLDPALDHLERSLRMAEAVFGEDHPEVAIRASNIALILQDQGDLDGALAYAQRALKLDEKVFGKNHFEVAIDANNIALILKDQGDLDGALAYAQRALKLDEGVFGEDHPNVARDANNIAMILKDQGELGGALTYAKRGLKIDEDAFGENHPKVAIRANNIAMILQDQGDLDGALRYAQRALQIDVNVFGENHPKVAIRANNIATILRDQGDLDGALGYLERALEVLEATYRPENPTTTLAAKNLDILKREIRERDGGGE